MTQIDYIWFMNIEAISIEDLRGLLAMYRRWNSGGYGQFSESIAEVRNELNMRQVDLRWQEVGF
jgi:hypothetical protein